MPLIQNQVAGIPGAVIATFGCILPSCLIVMTLAYIYYHFRGLKMVQGILAGLRPAVVAMIASAGISLVILSFYGERILPDDLSAVNAVSVIIFGASFFVLRKWKKNPHTYHGRSRCCRSTVIFYNLRSFLYNVNMGQAKKGG